MSIETRIAAARKGKLFPVQIAFDYIVHALKANHQKGFPVNLRGLLKDCSAHGFNRANTWHVLHSLETIGAVAFLSRDIQNSTCVYMQIVWLGGDE